MKQVRLLMVVLGVMMLLFSTQAFATPLFSDDFSWDLSAWTGENGGSHNGIIDNGALTFTATDSGGDIFTASTYTSLTGLFELSFDYKGTASNSGGFAGYVESGKKYVLAGAMQGYPDPMVLLADNVGSKHYSIAFNAANPIQLWFEDFRNSGDGDVAGVAGNAFFDNVHLENSPRPNAAPEPATMLLLGTGLVGLAGFRKKFFRR